MTTGPLVLRDLSVRQFRAVDNVHMHLRPDMTVLTGENDAGKSATLDALGFLLGQQAITVADRSSWAQDGRLEVEAAFESADDPPESIHVRAALDVDGTRVVEVRDRLHRDFDDHPDRLPLPTLRTKLADLGVPNPGGAAKQPYVDAATSWIASQHADAFEDRWRPAGREDLDRLPILTRFDSAEAPSPTNHIHAVVNRDLRVLLRSDKYAQPLGLVEQSLQDDVAPSVEHIRSKILEYCDDLDDVQLRASIDFTKPSLQVAIHVERKGEVFDLEKSGQGRRRRIVLAIHEANLASLQNEPTDRSEILIYDEPDTHLDYASQRVLFDILERQARLPHVQVIVATHSLNFIDKVALEAILHLHLSDDLKTDVEVLARADQEEEIRFLSSVCAGLGLRNSVLLDERCFLVIEGETEEAAIPTLFRSLTGRSITAAGLSLINTRGSGSLGQVLETLVHKWHRVVVMLADEDTRDKNATWFASLGLELDATAFFIGAKEFEDAFDDATWLRTLEKHFSPTDGTPWAITELAEVRASTKYSEALLNLVRKRCTNHTISKPDLGLALANTATTQDLPAALVSCLRAAEQAAGR